MWFVHYYLDSRGPFDFLIGQWRLIFGQVRSNWHLFALPTILLVLYHHLYSESSKLICLMFGGWCLICFVCKINMVGDPYFYVIKLLLLTYELWTLLPTVFDQSYEKLMQRLGWIRTGKKWCLLKGNIFLFAILILFL